MKVLLVLSYLGGNEPPVFPLGLACLKAALGGHEVRVFDSNVVDNSQEGLRNVIREFNPDVIGVSLRNIDSTNKRKVVFYYRYFKDMIRLMKSCSRATIVAGGAGFSMFASDIMRDEPGIDLGVCLEGETVFPCLLENLGDPGRVDNVCYRKEGTVVFSRALPSCGASLTAIPDMSILPLEPYTRFRDGIGVETKRGCPMKCIYCVYGFLNGTAYRLKPPSLVADEVQRLEKDYGIRRFTFVDSVFNLPFDHAEQICREIIRRRTGVKWSAWFSEKQITADFLNLVAEAGCDHVILSPDGYSDDVLHTLGKNISNRNIREAFALLARCPGLEMSYNFFKNPPGQTLGNFLGMIMFCVRARLRAGRRVHFEFSSMRVEPHSELYELAVREGAIPADANLLEPTYYTNRRTLWSDKLFDALLKLKGK